MQKSKISERRKFALFVQAILFVVFYIFISHFFRQLKSHPDLLVILILTTASLFLSIIIHEFGHFLFGKIMGYRLLAFKVGALALINQNGKMKLEIRKTKGISGYCAMIPDKEIPLYKHGFVCAGGIIFNLFIGAVSALLFILVPAMPDIWLMFLIYITGFSTFFGLANLIPYYSANSASDGMMLFNIILNKPFAQKIIEYHKISAQLAGGIRPGEICIKEVEDDDDSIPYRTAKLFCYFNALDRGDTEKAVKLIGWLEEHIDEMPSPSLPGIYYEICFTGCITNNAVKAKEYYEKGGSILRNDKDVNGLRVKAYYAYYIEHNKEKAVELCNEALTVAPKFPIRGQALMEETLVKDLKTLIHKQSVT